MATCSTYGVDGGRRPLMPGTPRPMDSLSPPSSQILHHPTRAHGAHDVVVMPPPPLLLDRYLGAKNHHSPSKATSPVSLLGPCTEGLGSESSDDVDLDGANGMDVGAAASDDEYGDGDKEEAAVAAARPESWRAYPPPISVIGKGGRPWLYFRAHREDGRLVLQEMRIPSQELLQACREDGRLKLQFVRPEPEPEPDDEQQEKADAAAQEQGQ